MTTEQDGAPSATAGGAPAPDFNAIRDTVIDSLRAVPLWQFRQGLVAAGLISADVEIQAAERKPVTSNPGIEAEWDEDVDAMRVDGIGWDLSFGCKVTFAYDHAKGEHYVCVSTSDADQRAGITSRRTTKEQLASLGQQLLNVFGEPDPRDAKIERLQESYELKVQDLTRETARVSAALRACDRSANPHVGEGGLGYLAAQEAIRNAIEGAGGSDPDPRDAEIERLREVVEARDEKIEQLVSIADKLEEQRDEAREECKRADAEVTRLKRLVGDENVPFDGWDGLSRQDAIVRCEEGWREYLKVRDERDRLRQELDGLPRVYGRLVNQMIEAQREDARVEVATLDQLAGELNELTEVLKAETGTRILHRQQRDEAHAERDAMANGLVAIQRNLTAINITLGKLKKPAEPRRWVAGDPEPEVGTTVRRDTYQFTRHQRGWHRDGICAFTPEKCPARGGSWAWMTSTGRPLYEVVSTDGRDGSVDR